MNKTKTYRKTCGRRKSGGGRRKTIRKTGGGRRKTIRRTGRKIFKGGAFETISNKDEFDNSLSWANKWQICHRLTKKCINIEKDDEGLNEKDKQSLLIAINDKINFEVYAL